ncbi:MAG: right-handed parallel beta-helix repeat-containing protein [Cryomorphaceae bacterium]|nr:MAG: right-handed parallel beta-helix repeat-containing protein [Cryomorphaceae bacterium]
MFKIFSLLLFFISSQNSAISATYYFDSVNGSDLNQGISSEKPFRTLNKINEIDFNSGDSILLSNGSYFSGNIKLIDKNDIHISNYNNQEKTYPIINSKGHIAGVYIENSSNISVTNIQVTANGGGVIEEYENLSTNKITDKAIMRAGILVNVSKKKIFKNILIDNVIVSNVFFEDLGFKRDPSEVRTSMGTQAYGFGIRFFNSSQSGSIEDIIVSNCFIENVGHTGIKMTSSIGNRFKNIEVSNNRLLRTGGPSIQFSRVEDLHVYGNEVKFSGSPDDSRKWGRGSGLWTWGSSNVLIEKNSFMYANGPADSAGVHIDFNCDNVIIQHNLSVGNAGGFIEILGNNYNCSYRYNISVNDGHRIKGQNNAFQEGKTFWLSGFIGGGRERNGPFNSYIYNNTIYVKEDIISKIAVDKASNGVLVANNIFHIEGDSEFVLGDQYRPDKGGGNKIKNVFFENNLFLKDSYWPKDVLIQPLNSLFGNANFKNGGGEKISNYIPLNNKLIKDKGVVINNIYNDSIGLKGGLNVEFDILGNKIKDLPDLGAIELN